ncbi:hypothetical protein ACU6TU_09770 [Halomonas sp. LS-001]
MNTSSSAPQDALLDELLDPWLAAQPPQGCLIPLPAQTGIGKTHAILNKLLKQLMAAQASGAPPPRMYYITNSVDNVFQAFNTLNRLIDQRPEGERQALKKYLVYLPNQGQQLRRVSPWYIDHLMKRFGLDGNKHMQAEWKSLRRYHPLGQGAPDVPAEIESMLTEMAGRFYGGLAQAIQRRQREAPLDINADDQAALNALMPGNCLITDDDPACLGFMTTRKFLRGFHTTRTRHFPGRNAGNTLIIMDEFDRQNEIILQHMVEQKAVDLIDFLRDLYANLNRYRLERSTRYDGIHELLDAFTQQLNSFAEQWQLEFAFNLEGDSLHNNRVQLFSDRAVTHAHSSQHHLSLNTDVAKHKNVIQSLNKNAPEGLDEQALTRFVNGADRLYQGFMHTMRQAVWQYQRNTPDETRPGSSAIRQRDVVNAILEHYNLAEKEALVMEALDLQGKPHTGKAGGQGVLSNYHARGFKLTSIRRNGVDGDTVGCLHTGISHTPTSLLAQWVEAGACVLGISATAEAPTVVHNFDLHYLAGRLGSQLQPLSAEQRSRLEACYHACRRYDEEGILLETHFIAPQRATLRQALNVHENKVIRQPVRLLNRWMQLDDESEFILDWVSRLIVALATFARQDDRRYMLVLLNRTLSPVGHARLVEFLQAYLDRQSSEAGTGNVYLAAGMNAEAMRHNRFEKVREKLSNGERVVVLSTYASMGEGKNPEYPVQCEHDRQALCWVGDGPAPEEVKSDIDTLYLEKPSYCLLSDADNSQANQLLLFHQIMVLQEVGCLSARDARRWVMDALHGVPHNSHLSHYYQTSDFKAQVCKMVEQAVGRMARTAFKRSRITLLGEDGLVPILAEDSRSPHGRSHEYLAMLKAAQHYYNNAIPLPESQQEKHQQRINRARLNTHKTLTAISVLLGQFGQSPSEGSIQAWESLRTTLLERPVMDNLDSPLYLESPDPESYRYKGSLEVVPGYRPLRCDVAFFELATGGKWVSEMESGLPVVMRNPQVKGYFEAQGYATQWPSGKVLMNPAAFNNLYKGALGEEGCKAVLEQAGLRLLEVPASVYELCDFIIEDSGERIAVDAKHWSQPGDPTGHAHKVARLAEAEGIQRFVYINLLGQPQRDCQYLNHDMRTDNNAGNQLLTVPGLLDQQSGALLDRHLHALIDWLAQGDKT